MIVRINIFGKDGMRMVAVDYTVLTGILVISSILAYIFLLRRMRTKQPNPADTAVSLKPSEEALISNTETEQFLQPEDPPKKHPLTECSYHFGYLSSLPKKRNLPTECLECARMTKCKSRRKPRKARHKRTVTVLATDEATAFPKQ
jgi:hypothetical protein